MPNWNFTTYVVKGDEKQLHEMQLLMDKLSKLEQPLIDNEFGTNWLGCLVHELGDDEEKVFCRGEWVQVETRDDGTLLITTCTAYDPCNDVFKILKGRFPSLVFYYFSEEPNNGLYSTNDPEGYFFTERFVVLYCIPDGELQEKAFRTIDQALAWISDSCEVPVLTEKELEDYKEYLETNSPDTYLELCKVKVFPDGSLDE